MIIIPQQTKGGQMKNVSVRDFAIAVVLGILIVASFGWAGNADYEDAVDQANHCQKMVEEGTWPKEVCQ